MPETFIVFSVPGTPVAKGRPRAVVRRSGARVWAGSYTPAKTRAAEETFAARSIAHRPPSPLAGPITVELRFTFGVPRSWSKRKRSAALIGALYHTTKLDIDNLAKMAIDAMTGVFFLDDKQIVRLVASKGYGAEPRTWVTIRALPEWKADAGR